MKRFRYSNHSSRMIYKTKRFVDDQSCNEILYFSQVQQINFVFFFSPIEITQRKTTEKKRTNRATIVSIQKTKEKETRHDVSTRRII